MAPPIPTTALRAPITTQRYQGASGCLVTAPTNLGLPSGESLGPGGFPQQNPWVFNPTKTDQHLGCEMGVPPFKETLILPSQCQTMQNYKENP